MVTLGVWSNDSKDINYLPSLLRMAYTDASVIGDPVVVTVSSKIFADYVKLVPEVLKESQNIGGDDIQFSPYLKMVEDGSFEDNQLMFTYREVVL